MSRPEVIDYLLGEEPEHRRAALQLELAEDLDLATDLAETRALFEDLRGLTVEPSARVPLAVRYQVLRRAELRRPAQRTRGERLRIGTWVVGVAALWLGLSLLLFAPPDRSVAHRDRDAATIVLRRPTRLHEDREARALLAESAPVEAARFLAQLERLETLEPEREAFGAWIAAENRLALLRREYQLRFSAEARARARARTGTPDLDDRIAGLAAEVARRLEEAFATGEERAEATAFGLRALVAAGSAFDVGPHHRVVETCVERLMAMLPGLDAAGRATALLALADLAVVGGGQLEAVVGREADRLARETLRRPISGHRPALLHWRTSAAALADAGRLFQISPAFGAHPAIAARARRMIAAHLAERLVVHGDEERPALIAAQLYGFGDLVDRRSADRRLVLWRAKHLLPDYVALHQLAWSRYPVRAGWADFQNELRGLAGLPDPTDTRDAAALLLCLSMNSAAPGVLDDTLSG